MANAGLNGARHRRIILAMCYLVTIGTSESRAGVDTLVGHESSLTVHPSRNSSLRSVFPHGDHLFEVTYGLCSCDLVIARTDSSRHDQRERLRAGYERRGWSQTKIGRALADWDSAHDRRISQNAAPQAALCALLQGLASRAGGVRVLVHFYAGRFDAEPVGSPERIRIAVDRLVNISVLGEDRLVEIVPHWVTGRCGF